MAASTRTCREYMDEHGDSRVNCCTCVKWSRENEKCADEVGVVQRYEETPDFADFKRMMETNKGVVLK